MNKILTMKAAGSETASSKPAQPISDDELAAILENSAWARMEREAKEFAEFAQMFRKVA